MSLSKKNYEAVAAVLAGSKRTGPELDGWDLGYEAHRINIADDLADYFAADNPRFDRARFLKACGL